MRSNFPISAEAFGTQFLRLWDGNIASTDVIYPLMLLSLRVATVLAVTPLLYAMPVPARVKVLLVLVLSIALAGNLDATQTGNELGNLLEAAVREVALGATLALGIMLAFAAFSVAGQMLDSQIGFGIAQVYDPMSGRSSPLLVSAFNTLAVLVFFLVNGHHALLRGLAYSVERFPVGASWAIEGAWTPILKQVSGLFTLGFALAAPVVFSILLVELALGVVARNLPQINMFALGIPLKIVVGLAVLSLWASMMGGVMTRVYASIYTTWDALFSESQRHQSLNGQGVWRKM
jgi:flagellar biosynthetic protein FliR